MTPERWRAVSHVFQSAVVRSPETQSDYLAEVCAGDAALLAEVESLLQAHERAGDFLERDSAGHSLAGHSVGTYTIGDRIGAGGMGEVYAATDSRLGRRVALKFLSAHLTADPERVLRFRQEARATSALNHPNILTIHDVGELESRHYIACEYVEGETLRSRLLRGRIPTPEAVSIVMQIASALGAAHAAGVIHRDIKPENVMLRSDGLVKVLDFGLAKLIDARDPQSMSDLHTGEGIRLGTPSYMAPEQIRGTLQDVRTDLWSVGVVLYEVLTGHRPFEGQDSILNDDPPPAQMFPALGRIVAKSLQKKPEDRYQSSAELTADLQRIRPIRRVRARFLAIGAAVIIAAIAAFGILRLRPDVPRTAATLTVPFNSVAVLPFVDLSQQRGDEYLADGLTEELINALSLVPRLKVVSRTSSFALKGSKDDVPVLSRRLNVGCIVEGTVRKAGNRLRVTADLVNAADGYRLWSEEFDEEITDIYAIQHRIATSVANALQPRLGGRPLTGKGTRDAEAYDLYLKGRQASSLTFTSDQVEKAIAYFRASISHDPSFSDAWAGLANAYALLDHAAGVPSLRPEESYRLAEEAGRHALALDPNSAEAHAALGHIYIHTGAIAEAGRHLKRAVELNPNSGFIRVWYALYFEYVGQSADVREQFLRARESDPLSVYVIRHGEQNLAYAGDYDGAIDFARAHLQIAPDAWEPHLEMSKAYAFTNRISDAEEELARGEQASPRPPRKAVAVARAVLLTMSDRHAEALAIIDQLARDEVSGSEPERTLLQLYAMAGDNDKAAQWLEAMVRRSPNYARANTRLPADRAFDAFRADARYLRVCHDFGIASWVPPLQKSDHHP